MMKKLLWIEISSKPHHLVEKFGLVGHTPRGRAVNRRFVADLTGRTGNCGLCLSDVLQPVSKIGSQQKKYIIPFFRHHASNLLF
jgi:hypothetical protein